jgi:two-component system sensor histidine kinase RegB
VAVDVWVEAIHRRWRQRQTQCASRVEIIGPSPAPEIVVAPTLEQGVINLLDNAVKADGGAIILAVRWDAATLAIEVRDRGRGFSAEVLRQAGRAPFPAHAGGSGIGLLLAQSVIERLGGRLVLANAADGGGIARIELPLDKICP